MPLAEMTALLGNKYLIHITFKYKVEYDLLVNQNEQY